MRLIDFLIPDLPDSLPVSDNIWSDHLTGSRFGHCPFQSIPVYDIASVYKNILNFRYNCNIPFHVSRGIIDHAHFRKDNKYSKLHRDSVEVGQH